MSNNNILKLLGKINPPAQKCLRFGFSLTVALMLAALTAIAVYTYAGGALYLFFAQDAMTCALDCAAAVVIASLFWDAVAKFGGCGEEE